VTRTRARWAVLGSSDFATEWIMPAVLASSRGTLGAIISRDLDVARRIADRYGAPIAVTSISELPPDAIDVVHLVAPNELHEPLTLEAISCGLDVLVEKPMAPSVESARRMADAAQAAGRLLAVGHCMAWAPPVVRAVEAIREGRVGRVVSATIAASFDSPPAGLWRQLRTTEDGGGPLQDLGPHMVDALLRLLGPIREVTATLDRLLYDYAAEDTSSTLLRFASGAQAVMQASFACSQNDLTIQGTAGRLSSREWLGRDFTGELAWTPIDRGVGTFGPDDRPTDSVPYTLTRQNVYVPQVDNVSAAIMDGTALAAPPSQGIAVLSVIEAAIRSAREGRTVTLADGGDSS
jgi:predicted dehydrogenase